MVQKITFSKLHGLGNDFILIENLKGETKLNTEQIQFLCNRRFGIGADGIMLVEKPINPANDFSWFFANSDGTFPEMCGNGIRAFAHYVKNHGLIAPNISAIRIETLAGVKVAEFDGEDQVRVDMGIAQSVSDGKLTTLPMVGGGVIDAEIKLGSPVSLSNGPKKIDSLLVSAVSMGNPHAVIFADELGLTIDDELIETLGPKIEAHPEFPHKTNVEFIAVADRQNIEMRVYERGVGETLACGTGACAAAFAAYQKGRIDSRVTVHLLGGNLQIEITPNQRVYMTGPAEEVYSGEINLMPH